jgi:hypothetical protein
MASVRLLAVAALASCLIATNAMAQTFVVNGLSFTVDGLSSGSQVIGLIAFSVKAAPALAMCLILAAMYRRSFVAKWLLVAVALSYLDSFLVTHFLWTLTVPASWGGLVVRQIGRPDRHIGDRSPSSVRF